MALGRVLTLVIVVDEHDADDAIDAANDASRAAPVPDHRRRRGQQARRRPGSTPRSGSAATPARREVVVLRLYGAAGQARPSRSSSRCCCPTPPSSPGGPTRRPTNPSSRPDRRDGPAPDHRRRRVDQAPARGAATAGRRATPPATPTWPGSRITLWRGLLAAALDQPPYEPVTRATVVAAPDSPSGDLLAGWLAVRLRCPVSIARARNRSGIISVRLERDQRHGRPGPPVDGNTATLSPAGPAGAYPGPSPPRAMPSASPTSCGASTPTRSTRTPW